jgi:hypothetical protein
VLKNQRGKLLFSTNKTMMFSKSVLKPEVLEQLNNKGPEKLDFYEHQANKAKTMGKGDAINSASSLDIKYHDEFERFKEVVDARYADTAKGSDGGWKMGALEDFIIEVHDFISY